MLGEKSLKIKSKKKQLFIGLIRNIGILNKITWQASSEFEYNEIRSVFPNAKIRVASNIPYAVLDKEIDLKRVKYCNRINFFVVLRITPVKNLLFSIQLLKKAIVDNTELVFSIYGPVEDVSYWEKCKKEIDNIHFPNLKIEYKGEVKPIHLKEELSNKHFLLLPTLNENFGHVIVESLSFGCPVIISDQTPWRNLQYSNVGWDISLADEKRFIEVIKECIKMHQEEYDSMSASTSVYLREKMNIDEIIEETKKLFLN